MVGRCVRLRRGCGLTRGGGDDKVEAWTMMEVGEGCRMGRRGDGKRRLEGEHYRLQGQIDGGEATIRRVWGGVGWGVNT